MLDSWSKVAKIRSRQISSGIDLTFDKVFVPYFLKIVREIKPTNILEIGAGTGHLALILSDETSQLVALEPAAGMHNIASHTLAESKVNFVLKRIED